MSASNSVIVRKDKSRDRANGVGLSWLLSNSASLVALQPRHDGLSVSGGAS